jgi:hypothetical protein
MGAVRRGGGAVRPGVPFVSRAAASAISAVMPVTRKGLEAQQQASKESQEMTTLLNTILEQQKQILAALEKLAAK